MKEIYLVGKNGSVIGNYALVDDSDYDLVSNYRWNVRIIGCNIKGAYSWRNGKQLAMHRLIMNVEDPKIQVDHINGNTLNNQRSFLRLATNSQNQFNRIKTRGASSYKGVSRAYGTKWSARIEVGDVRRWLGSFKSEEDAALAYNEAAIKYHGEFARLNIIDRHQKHI